MRVPNLLLNDSVLVVYPAGVTIFRAGDPGDCMYVVKEGEVDIHVDGRLVETVGKDGIFGELALIDNEPRGATATAATNVTLYPVDQRTFLFAVDETPFFAISVMRIMSQRLRRRPTTLNALPPPE